jgi:hypothetical protein
VVNWQSVLEMALTQFGRCALDGRASFSMTELFRVAAHGKKFKKLARTCQLEHVKNKRLLFVHCKVIVCG